MKVFRRYSRRVILAARPLRHTVRLSSPLYASPALRHRTDGRKSAKSSPAVYTPAKSAPSVQHGAVGRKSPKSSPGTPVRISGTVHSTAKPRSPPSREVRRQLNFGQRDCVQDGAVHSNTVAMDNPANATAVMNSNPPVKDAGVKEEDTTSKAAPAAGSLSRSDTVTAGGFDTPTGQSPASDVAAGSGGGPVADAGDAADGDADDEATRSPAHCGLMDLTISRQDSALKERSFHLNPVPQGDESESKRGSTLSRSGSNIGPALPRSGSNLSNKRSNLGPPLPRSGSNMSAAESQLASPIPQNAVNLDSPPSGLDWQVSDIELRTAEIIHRDAFSLLNPFNGGQLTAAPPSGEKENQPPTPAATGLLNPLSTADPWTHAAIDLRYTV